jgi:hypothetical protein
MFEKRLRNVFGLSMGLWAISPLARPLASKSSIARSPVVREQGLEFAEVGMEGQAGAGTFGS